jgi:hypothetical protein
LWVSDCEINTAASEWIPAKKKDRLGGGQRKKFLFTHLATLANGNLGDALNILQAKLLQGLAGLLLTAGLLALAGILGALQLWDVVIGVIIDLLNLLIVNILNLSVGHFYLFVERACADCEKKKPLDRSDKIVQTQ